MKKILVTAGPIPARLDSVKYVTNSFKGGLAALTAADLSRDFEVEVVKWRHSRLELPPSVRVRDVEDVLEYRDAVLSTDAGAYVLAAAVANLMPVRPWKGKFPSHEYGVGDEFDVRFAISPRVIDEIRKARPRSALIGYKLFDGSDEELVRAGTITLRESMANVVFCNRPGTAKSEKVALTQDGARIRMSFAEHVELIRRVANLEWYRTTEVPHVLDSGAWSEAEALLGTVSRRAFTSGELSFGTLAVRASVGFVTTTRGKRGRGLCHVSSVDPSSRTVCASAKATMNAPTLDRLLRAFPGSRYVLHAHSQIAGAPTHGYSFPGTPEEDRIPASRVFNVEHHGYYAVLDTKEELIAWLDRHHP